MSLEALKSCNVPLAKKLFRWEQVAMCPTSGGHNQGEPKLPPETSPSLAAESYLREQRAMISGSRDLDEGLEDTFPASDPVSATHTTRPGTAPAYTKGDIKSAVENKIRDRPLADLAIAAGLGFIFGLTR
jgi:hypothetical protein